MNLSYEKRIWNPKAWKFNSGPGLLASYPCPYLNLVQDKIEGSHGRQVL